MMSARLAGATESPDRAEVHENLAKADAVVHWLRAVGAHEGRGDVGALGADLSDLYVGAEKYRRLLDELLKLGPDELAEASDKVGDVADELRHLGWHIRSAVRRLDRLGARLDPDDA